VSPSGTSLATLRAARPNSHQILDPHDFTFVRTFMRTSFPAELFARPYRNAGEARRASVEEPPHMKLDIDEHRLDAVMEATFWANPVADSRFRFAPRTSMESVRRKSCSWCPQAAACRSRFAIGGAPARERRAPRQDWRWISARSKRTATRRSRPLHRREGAEEIGFFWIDLS
jgi:hypothetical protein